MRSSLISLVFIMSLHAQMNAATAFPDAAELNKMASRLAPTPLEVDVSGLNAGDRTALIKSDPSRTRDR